MATDFFLKLDGIKGESTQANHKDEIDILSIHYGATAPSQIASGSAGMSGGKASFSEVTFTKHTDKSSPTLFKAIASGQHIGTAVFTGQKMGGESLIYFKITLSTTIVTSYHNSGSSGDSILTESISFGYSKIVFDYTEQTGKGGKGGLTSGGYDVTTNKAI